VNKVMGHIMVSSVMTPYSIVHCVPTFKRNIRLPSSDTEKMEAVYTTETPVPFYETTRCHNSEDCNMNLNRCKNLRCFVNDGGGGGVSTLLGVFQLPSCY
jgi:hypothetical protein